MGVSATPLSAGLARRCAVFLLALLLAGSGSPGGLRRVKDASVPQQLWALTCHRPHCPWLPMLAPEQGLAAGPAPERPDLHTATDPGPEQVIGVQEAWWRPGVTLWRQAEETVPAR